MIESKIGRLPDHYMYDVKENSGHTHLMMVALGWNRRDGNGVDWAWILQPNGETVSRTRESVQKNRLQFAARNTST